MMGGSAFWCLDSLFPNLSTTFYLFTWTMHNDQQIYVALSVCRRAAMEEYIDAGKAYQDED